MPPSQNQQVVSSLRALAIACPPVCSSLARSLASEIDTNFYLNCDDIRNNFDPRYSWLSNFTDLSHRKSLEQHYEILLPLIPRDNISATTVNEYKQALQDGEAPIALALSILDRRIPGGRGIERGLAHFILDGHHKIQSASELGTQITLLSFLFKGITGSREIPKDVISYYQGNPLEFKSVRK